MFSKIIRYLDSLWYETVVTTTITKTYCCVIPRPLSKKMSPSSLLKEDQIDQVSTNTTGLPTMLVGDTEHTIPMIILNAPILDVIGVKNDGTQYKIDAYTPTLSYRTDRETRFAMCNGVLLHRNAPAQHSGDGYTRRMVSSIMTKCRERVARGRGVISRSEEYLYLSIHLHISADWMYLVCREGDSVQFLYQDRKTDLESIEARMIIAFDFSRTLIVANSFSENPFVGLSEFHLAQVIMNLF